MQIIFSEKKRNQVYIAGFQADTLSDTRTNLRKGGANEYLISARQQS